MGNAHPKTNKGGIVYDQTCHNNCFVCVFIYFINLWLDGELVLEHEDSVVNEGSVGIGLANYIARFDSVQISGPDVSDYKPLTWKEQVVQSHDRLATAWGEIKSD